MGDDSVVKVEIECPECGQTLRVPIDYSGIARCPPCNFQFPVEAKSKLEPIILTSSNEKESDTGLRNSIDGRPGQMMSFIDAIRSVYLFKPLVFKGRASRSEFWFSQLAYILAMILWFLLAWLFFDAILSAIYLPAADGPTILIFFLFVGFVHLAPVIILGIPLIAVGVRRFHDLGHNGWLYVALQFGAPLIPFIGWIGPIVALVITALEGQIGANEYGEVPSNSLEGLEAAFRWGQNQPTNP